MSDIGRLIRAGTLSSTAMTEQMLDRIKRLDPTLESYATLMADAALDAARAADRDMRAGTDRGPLHGVPIAVKDLRHRHRRFNPLPLICQRGGRTEAHVRTCEPPWRDGVVRNT
jgi:Amidase